MLATISQYLAGVNDARSRKAIQDIVNPIADRVSTLCLSSAGLVIKAGASAIVKAGTVFYASAQGVLVTKAANTDMAALSGTVTNAKFNVYAFFIDKAGTLTSAMGTEGTTLAAVIFPPLPQGKALIGFVVINPTGTGPFVGGTTALDDATVVPTAVYVNTNGCNLDPTVLLGST